MGSGHLALIASVAALAALAAACGSTEEDNDVVAEVAAGGAGGQSSAGAAGAPAGPPPCEGMLGLSSSCPHQVVLSPPGAGGGAGASACVIQLEFEDFDPDMVNVAVDCELVHLCASDHDATDECWHFDDADAPTSVVLSEARCARVTAEGYTRIDIVGGCGGPVLE